MHDQLTIKEGREVLNLARQTIQGHLGLESETSKIREEAGLAMKCATFVTLKKDGALRGCIGSLVPDGTIYESVCRNAVQAAFHDSRFRPLNRREMESIQIDISILTPPQPLHYKTGDDLLTQLRPKVDGVTIRHGMNSATFLPQVWKQLPDPEQFLGQLCRKAGLDTDIWREGLLEVEIYQVQCVKEDA